MVHVSRIHSNFLLDLDQLDKQIYLGIEENIVQPLLMKYNTTSHVNFYDYFMSCIINSFQYTLTIKIEVEYIPLISLLKSENEIVILKMIRIIYCIGTI